MNKPVGRSQDIARECRAHGAGHGALGDEDRGAAEHAARKSLGKRAGLVLLTLEPRIDDDVAGRGDRGGRADARGHVRA